MRYLPAIFLGVTLFFGCQQGIAVDPAVFPPTPAPGASACAAMCAHIGPTGLNCPEGQPVYDSALPGPKGTPNESCTDFCSAEEKNGIYVNPSCVAQAPTCGDIETWRLHTCL